MRWEDVYSLIRSRVSAGEKVALQAYPGFGKTRLLSVLARELGRSLVVTRTHAEMAEVARFSSMKVRYAYGRQALCWRLRSYSPAACRSTRRITGCRESLTREEYAWLAAVFREPEEVREYARARAMCPYRALMRLVREARFATITYEYLFEHPEVADGKTLLLDEAHALMDYVVRGVREFGEGEVLRIIARYKGAPDPVEKRKAYVLKRLLRDMRAATSIYELEDLLSRYSEALDLPELDEVVRAIRRGTFVAQGSTLYYSTRLLPRLASDAVVQASIYVPPIVTDREVLKVESPQKVPVVIDTRVTTRYTERGPGLPGELASVAREYISHTCGNLVVAPSREIADAVAKILGADREPRGSLGPGEVVVAPAGGRMTEGVNIAGLCRVIVLGMPFPPPDPRLDVVARVHGFENTYLYISMLRALQAIGRLRFRGLGVLADSRYERYADYLPSWIEVKETV